MTPKLAHAARCTRREQHHRSHGEEAQGVIEFAILSVFLVYTFLGTVDFARTLFYQNAITSAARVGAEVASNHCTPTCPLSLNATTVDYVVQATVCENSINLKPQPAAQVAPLDKCDPCIPQAAGPSGCNNPYSTTNASYVATAPSLTQDVYVYGAPAAGTNPALGASPQLVRVTVGYNFSPIAPFTRQFFSEKSCYPGDVVATNHHTLCATATGKVAT